MRFSYAEIEVLNEICRLQLEGINQFNLFIFGCFIYPGAVFGYPERFYFLGDKPFSGSAEHLTCLILSTQR